MLRLPVRIMKIGNMPWRYRLYSVLCMYVDVCACEWVQVPLESKRGRWIFWTCYQLLDVAAGNWTRVLSRAESALNPWVIFHHLLSMAPSVGIRLETPNWKCLPSFHIQLKLCWIFCIIFITEVSFGNHLVFAALKGSISCVPGVISKIKQSLVLTLSN